jgi:DNA-binding response OmpR family regulator
MNAGELVLLVNDVPDHATNYEAALTRHGFRVQRASRGEEALAAVRASLPSCAVIDLRLPDMSGWDLCKEISAHTKGRKIRLIVLTPDVSKMCAADSAKVGCHAWLAHPTGADELARTVKQVLDLHEDAPQSTDEALLGLKLCPACESEQVRATLRIGTVQYYCCRGCSFCWRVEALTSN